MKNKNARLFFAYPIEPTEAQQISNWFETISLNTDARIIPPENYHITIAFVGDHPRSDIPELIEYATTLIHPTEIQCQYLINKIGYFKQGILYATGWNTPLQMIHIIKELSFFVHASEHHRSVVPHITLARNAEHVQDFPEFEFKLSFTRISLFESLNEENGVEYKPLYYWPSAKKASDFNKSL